MDLRQSAILMALPVMVLGAVGIWTETGERWFAHGPIQQGHADVACRDCHGPSPGTARQQIQAKLHHVLGLRDDAADFGRTEVTSDQCLACHQRPNERHPIYRFREPRFIEALQEVPADTCLGCHSEHQAARVAADTRFCATCHGDLKLANDPVNIPHKTLIANEKWGTCLGCHDFHGNHAYEPPTHVQSLISEMEVQAYFGQGQSPYGPFKLFEAKDQ